MQPYWFCNLPVKRKRGLANDLTHTSITHASLVHNITNGSVYGCITAAYLSKGKKKKMEWGRWVSKMEAGVGVDGMGWGGGGGGEQVVVVVVVDAS